MTGERLEFMMVRIRQFYPNGAHVSLWWEKKVLLTCLHVQQPITTWILQSC